MKLFESASKIVFLALTIAACVGLFTGVVSEANFMLLAIAAFSFYFAKPVTPSSSTTTSVTTNPPVEK